MSSEIADRLERLRDYVATLRGYSKRTLAELRSDTTLRGATERYLELAIQSSLDLGETVIAANRWRKPTTYREIIEILAENGVLDEELAGRFVHAAGFRNILVHMYADIDLAKVHEFLGNNLGDFDEYTKAISSYLLSNPSKKKRDSSRKIKTKP